VFVVLGDGECNEGSVWESAMACAQHGVDNLAALIDYNEMQSYDTTHTVVELEPFADKWRSFGFGVAEVNGHDVQALRDALRAIPLVPARPTALLCHTVKGKGIAFTEHDATWHHKSRIRDDEIQSLLRAIEEYPCARRV
jgi:transketolase